MTFHLISLIHKLKTNIVLAAKHNTNSEVTVKFCNKSSGLYTSKLLKNETFKIVLILESICIQSLSQQQE